MKVETKQERNKGARVCGGAGREEKTQVTMRRRRRAPLAGWVVGCSWVEWGLKTKRLLPRAFLVVRL